MPKEKTMSEKTIDSTKGLQIAAASKQRDDAITACVTAYKMLKLVNQEIANPGPFDETLLKSSIETCDQVKRDLQKLGIGV